MFAAYYLLLIKLRRFKVYRRLNRGSTEDFGAMLFVLLIPIYIFFFVAFTLKKIIGLNIFPTFNFGLPTDVKIIILILVSTAIYLGDRYFLSNWGRRNRLIDDFRELDRKKRNYWNIIAFIFLLSPVWLLIYTVVKIITR